MGHRCGVPHYRRTLDVKCGPSGNGSHRVSDAANRKVYITYILFVEIDLMFILELLKKVLLYYFLTTCKI